MNGENSSILCTLHITALHRVSPWCLAGVFSNRELADCAWVMGERSVSALRLLERSHRAAGVLLFILAFY